MPKTILAVIAGATPAAHEQVVLDVFTAKGYALSLVPVASLTQAALDDAAISGVYLTQAISASGLTARATNVLTPGFGKPTMTSNRTVGSNQRLIGLTTTRTDGYSLIPGTAEGDPRVNGLSGTIPHWIKDPATNADPALQTPYVRAYPVGTVYAGSFRTLQPPGASSAVSMTLDAGAGDRDGVAVAARRGFVGLWESSADYALLNPAILALVGTHAEYVYGPAATLPVIGSVARQGATVLDVAGSTTGETSVGTPVQVSGPTVTISSLGAGRYLVVHPETWTSGDVVLELSATNADGTATSQVTLTPVESGGEWEDVVWDVSLDPPAWV